jgi:hypothetical protein
VDRKIYALTQVIVKTQEKAPYAYASLGPRLDVKHFINNIENAPMLFSPSHCYYRI